MSESKDHLSVQKTEDLKIFLEKIQIDKQSAEVALSKSQKQIIEIVERLIEDMAKVSSLSGHHLADLQMDLELIHFLLSNHYLDAALIFPGIIERLKKRLNSESITTNNSKT